MGVSLTDSLLGPDPPQAEVEKKAADFDTSYLEEGVVDTDTSGLLQGNSIETHGKKSSFWQTTANCANIMLGMGLLALPASLEEAGWLSLIILLAFGIICLYTGVLLGRCLQTNSSLKSYQDIGDAAYGSSGRMFVTIFLFSEVAALFVGNTISLGDNLARIFPNAGLNLPWLGVKMEAPQVLATVGVMLALPTTWLRDMSSVSFVSFGGVVSSIIVIACTGWAGIFGGVGFHHSPPLLNLRNVPLVSGIYAYCYAGHVLIPSIHSGMESPAQFPKVLLAASAITSVMYGGMGILGASMFGEDTKSQITLNIPKNLVVATIALWTAVITPVSKYGLGIAPVAEQIESLLPFPRHSRTHLALGTIIRTLLVLLVLAVALAVPYFHDMLALLGSSISITMAVIFPALFYLKICRTSLSNTRIVCAFLCITVGIFFAIIGTETSLKALIQKMSS